MVGSIELDPDGKSLQIRFPYRTDLVDDVKAIPGRRWDRSGKLWRVPSGQIENVVAVFMRHGFTMTADVTGLLAGTHGTLTIVDDPGDESSTDQASEEETPDALSISKLNEKVKKTIHAGFPESVWVVGEITDYDKNKDRKHIFFTLTEKRGDSIVAQVSVAMFERTARMLRTRLDNLPEPLSLADGIQMRTLVRVDLYPRDGRFQLVVDDIDASFTLGKLALGREEILRELREKGLHDKNSSLALPVPSLRVGVLASLDSDAWNDFLAGIKASGLSFDLTTYDVRVQGKLLRPMMLQGLAYFARRAEDFDVLCIVRGGGSRTDLAWFDDRDIALAVANHPIKIICGIGHQRDQSVLDMIAHSENTPTAVADYLIQQVHHTREVLADLIRHLVNSAQRVLSTEGRRLTELAHGLRHKVRGGLAFERERLLSSGQRLAAGTRQRLRGEHNGLVRRAEQLCGGARRQLERARGFLATQSARQRLLDPLLVLKRGYTLARKPSGGIVTGIDGLAPGMEVDVVFRDGQARARIEGISPNEDSN